MVKALKGLLEKKQKKAKELTQEQYLRELRASKEVQILKKLEEEVYQLETREMWDMEKESFFKDQAKNGKLRSCKFPFFKNRK